MLIPAGEFQMGSIDADADADDDEKPVHTVYVAVDVRPSGAPQSPISFSARSGASSPDLKSE